MKWGRFKPEHERALDALRQHAPHAEVLRLALLVFTHCRTYQNLDAVLASTTCAKIITGKVAAAVGGRVGVDNDQRLVARARLHGRRSRARLC